MEKSCRDVSPDLTFDSLTEDGEPIEAGGGGTQGIV
jgi:hypothetical protein